jgi:response regulator NasT
MHELESLQAKMEEMRLVNRAKLILVQRFKMSEKDAHRFIEKNAMDRCVKRRTIAESIIRTYQN